MSGTDLSNGIYALPATRLGVYKLRPKLTARRECPLQGDYFVWPDARYWPISDDRLLKRSDSSRCAALADRRSKQGTEVVPAIMQSNPIAASPSRREFATLVSYLQQLPQIADRRDTD